MSGYRLGNVYVAGILYPRDIRRTRAESVGGVFVFTNNRAFQTSPAEAVRRDINGLAVRAQRNDKL